ncbi:kinase-like domain-containing protein, partial [Pelagophyceae sp. CCMP2097]
MYKLGTVIGHGSSGVVHQAYQQTTGARRASDTQRRPEASGHIAREIELLAKLEHPNIVKYFDVVDSHADGHLYIVLEYMENGSLSGVRARYGNFSEAVCSMYMRQVVSGLEYLHAQGVLHRDIKGANILTTKDGVAKLADFGVACAGSDSSVLDENVVGSPYWMAPEIIEMSAPPSTACDIWPARRALWQTSLGCTILELTEGQPPHFDLSPMQALFRIVSDDAPPLPAGASEALRGFLLRCSRPRFHRESVLRSTAAALLSHAWLK